MERARLGSSGLEVPPLAIGTAHFGDPETAAWHIGEERVRSLVRNALDCGLGFFDTATSYAGGLAESRLGAAIDALGARDEVLIATKVFFPTGPGPDDRGLSRRHLMKAVERSLERLRTDRIDLLYIHRWDCSTAIEETLLALEQLVRSGRVRHVGASSMSAWRLMKALSLQRHSGFTSFIAMQGHYNLLYREEEREMMPLCREEGLGYLAWSPLARGRLAGAEGDPMRMTSDRQLALWRREADDAPVIDALHSLAARRGEPAATLALAWLRSKGAIPVVGAASAEEIEVALRSRTIALGPHEIAALDQHYRPRAVAGFDPRDEVPPEFAAAGPAVDALR